MAPRRKHDRAQPSPLARRIRAVRERLGLTQASFARLIGSDARVFWRWEAENVEPAAATLALIADKAEVDAAWLITGEPSRAPAWFRQLADSPTTPEAA